MERELKGKTRNRFVICCSLGLVNWYGVAQGFNFSGKTSMVRMGLPGYSSLVVGHGFGVDGKQAMG